MIVVYFIFSFSSIKAISNQEALAKKAMKIYNKWAETKPNDKMIAIVIDADTGKVLYEEKGYMTHYPASLAKMMTLYLVFEQLKQGKMKLTDKLRVSKNAANKKPALINLVAGETISVQDAIKGSIIKSANDAATVLGEAIGKTEQKFAALMTEKARKLGMKKTIFQNASGWHDPKQISSPYDMALLGRALMRDFPQFYKFFSIKSFTYKGLSHPNKNRTCLNKIKGCDGIKTGFFTDPVGSNITASVKRGNKRIIAVVLGGRTYKYRNQKVEELIEKGFALLEKSKSFVKEKSKEVSTEVIELAHKGKKELSSDFDILLRKLEKDFQTSNHKNSSKKKLSSTPKNIPFKQSKDLPPPPSQDFPTLADARAPRWSIQVGTFTSLQMAQKEAERLFKTYPNLFKRDFLKIAQAQQKKIFPIRFTNLQKPQAELICKQLQQNKNPCIVISPRV